MKLNTINVIEIFDGGMAVHSFTDDQAGGREATRYFLQIAKDNLFLMEEIKDGLARDILQRDGYELRIAYSQSED